MSKMKADLVPTKIWLEVVGQRHRLRVDMTNTSGIVVEEHRIPLSQPAKHVPGMRRRAERYAKEHNIPFEDKTRGVY
jgi:hypothetical protein